MVDLAFFLCPWPMLRELFAGDKITTVLYVMKLKVHWDTYLHSGQLKNLSVSRERFYESNGVLRRPFSLLVD